MECIFEGIVGSQLYGVADETSDIDSVRILKPSLRELTTLHKPNIIEKKIPGQGECTILPLDKYLLLLGKGNPNMLETLFIPKIHTKHETSCFVDIYLLKDLFITKEIYHRCKGYAFSEFNTITKTTGKYGKKRKDLLDKHGYNTKSAYNCIRLLYEGILLLSTKQIVFPLKIREDLKKIKNGVTPYKKIEGIFNLYLTQLDYTFKHSLLPEKCDWDKIEELYQNIVLEE